MWPYVSFEVVVSSAIGGRTARPHRRRTFFASFSGGDNYKRVYVYMCEASCLDRAARRLWKLLLLIGSFARRYKEAQC